MKLSHYLKLGVALLVLPLAFQNCGGFEASNNGSFSSISETPLSEGPSTEPEQIPEYLKYIQPNIVADCAANPEYNACLFWKNPVAHANQAFPTNITENTSLEQYQTHAINVLGTDNSGMLRNTSINVTASSGARVNKPDMDFKISYDTQPSQVLQLMTYHWMQSLITLMKNRSGVFHAENQNVQVNAYDPSFDNGRYTFSDNSIRMGRVPAGTPFSLDGEIAAHELGHANHRHAGFDFQSSGSQACPANIGGTCCTNRNTGCSVAFAEGAADFMYALLFPTSTAGGETITNDLAAPARCGLNRNAVANRDLSINNITCNNAHMLGMIYASIWWEVRAQAEAAAPGTGALTIEALFSEHLMVLGQDTWTSAFNKIMTLDQNINGGAHVNLFVTEFNRRGIPVSAP